MILIWAKPLPKKNLKKNTKKVKDEYKYGDFDGFIEVESQYMDEITEAVFTSLREKERTVN